MRMNTCGLEVQQIHDQNWQQITKENEEITEEKQQIKLIHVQSMERIDLLKSGKLRIPCRSNFLHFIWM
jgi:hypothetical protein